MFIFDVVNRARVGFWCAAPDAGTAIEIAFAAGHAKKRENLTAKDVTERFMALDPERHDQESIRAILDGQKTGRVIGRGHSYNAAEFFAQLAAGDPPKPERMVWHVTPA